MATTTDNTNTPARLAAKRQTVVFHHPSPTEPDLAAFVIAGGHRSFEVRGPSTAGPVAARWHRRDGEWHVLAEGVAFDDALRAINLFADAVSGLPAGWSAANDAAELSALASVAAVFAEPADAALPLAA